MFIYVLCWFRLSFPGSSYVLFRNTFFDKVVFKEVPVEVVKKEVVHVPVYTNDKSLLGKK